jgi:hypothetical protein
MALGQMNGQFYLDETSSAAPTYVDPDVYSVYSIVVNSIIQYEFQQETTVPIYDHTATGQTICATPNKKHEAMLASAIANYAKVNKAQRRLLPRFNLDKPYEIIQRSPHAVYLSSIGFNRGKTVAVLSAFAASGSNYVLVKEYGKWQFLTNWSEDGCVWAS